MKTGASGLRADDFLLSLPPPTLLLATLPASEFLREICCSGVACLRGSTAILLGRFWPGLESWLSD